MEETLLKTQRTDIIGNVSKRDFGSGIDDDVFGDHGDEVTRC